MYWWVAGLGLIAAAGWLTSAFIAVSHARNERRRPVLVDRRAQAERVSVWPGRNADPQPIALLNSSNEPVYEAVATFVFIDGSGPTRGGASGERAAATIEGVVNPWHGAPALRLIALLPEAVPVPTARHSSPRRDRAPGAHASACRLQLGGDALGLVLGEGAQGFGAD